MKLSDENAIVSSRVDLVRASLDAYDQSDPS